MAKELGLRFGALSPKLADQLTEQGFNLPADAVEPLQRDMDAAVRLRARNLLSERSTQILEQRIHQRVCATIRDFGG